MKAEFQTATVPTLVAISAAHEIFVCHYNRKTKADRLIFYPDLNLEGIKTWH